jgi:hypothetical protein
MSTHQPVEAVFRSMLAENIDWEPFAAFPPQARLAVVVGHPIEPGPYVVRVKVPSGVKLMPGGTRHFQWAKSGETGEPISGSVTGAAEWWRPAETYGRAEIAATWAGFSGRRI